MDNNQNNDIEDIEMGDDVKINNYAKQNNETKAQEVNPTTETVSVDPSAKAPQMPSQEKLDAIQNPVPTDTSQKANPAQNTEASSSQPGAQGAQAQTQAQKNSKIKVTDPKILEKRAKARKKAFLGCFGAFFGVLIILLILAFVFIAQAHSGVTNPLESLFGVSKASFVNAMILFINLTFFIFEAILAVATIAGLVKILSAKKDDKESKKIGLRRGIIFFTSFFIFGIIWLFTALYLDGQRMTTEQPEINGVITEPAETLNLEAPVSINFDATSVDVGKDFRIISYRWDFGDGKVGTGAVVNHTYNDKGDDGRFDVVLEVTKQNEDTLEEFVDREIVIVTIAGEALQASFEASEVMGESPLKVTFDASSSTDPDSDIKSFEWDFDEDGEFDDATGYQTEYTFDKVGKYTVKLRVTNAVGEYSVAEEEITVIEGQEPEAIIKVIDEPEEFVLNRQYIFSGEDSSSPNGQIVEYIWDFGDGDEKNMKNTPFIFTTEGTYIVSLTVIDEADKEITVEREIIIGGDINAPEADFTTDPAAAGGEILSGIVPLEVKFDASSSTDGDNNIVDYAWDFDGDGEIDNYGKTVNHRYEDTGNFEATLTVTDADENTSSKSILIEVEEQGIIADLQANKIDGTVPLTVQFDASGSTYSGGAITSYKWDFGDGSAPILGNAKINHKYTSTGTYTASVEVIGSDNTKASKTLFITVREVALTACFDSVFTVGVAPLETTFDPNCSTGTIADYFWDFGDGSTSSQVKPSHTFEDAGTYTVTLEVSDSENTVDTFETQISVMSDSLDGSASDLKPIDTSIPTI